MNKEREISIKLLEAKIERITGKKVTYVENTVTTKPVLKEGEKKILKENFLIDVWQQVVNALQDPTVVNIAGDSVQRGQALQAFLGAMGLLGTSAALTTYGKDLLSKGVKILQILKAPGQKKAAVATPAKETPATPAQ